MARRPVCFSPQDTRLEDAFRALRSVDWTPRGEALALIARELLRRKVIDEERLLEIRKQRWATRKEIETWAWGVITDHKRASMRKHVAVAPNRARPSDPRPRRSCGVVNGRR